MAETSSVLRLHKCDANNNNNAKGTFIKDWNDNVVQPWQLLPSSAKPLRGFELPKTTPWMVNDESRTDFMYFSAENVTAKEFVKSGGRANVTVNEKDIALISHDNVVYAVQEKCPHIGGPLHIGDIEDVPGCGPCIKCPWHSWTFSLKTGKCIAPSGRDLAGHLETFPVRVNSERNEIKIGFTEIAPSIFSNPPP
ncbi:unnamed protein product [Orchesella dallaii]|uniref:Rieske domain-containing protein n=1 Tax=Orchesella dallaii TaxID=48710 RepID=A0ABP1PSS1_9HEXA